MKNIIKIVIVAICCLAIPVTGFSQTDNHHEHNHKQLDEKAAFEQFNLTSFMSEFSVVALGKGYDLKSDECLRNALIANQSNLFRDIFAAFVESRTKAEYADMYKKHMNEFINYLELFKRNELKLRTEFSRRFESSSGSYFKGSSPLPSPQGVCTNMDFETGNLNGWTSSNNTGGTGVSFVTTPGPDPLVNPINQVFAGNNSACVDVLPSFGNLDWAQIEQTFLVTNSNKDFIFYTAVIIDRPGHTPCSDNAKFEVSVRDAGGAVIPCSNIELIGANASGGACSVFNGFQTLGAYDYLNWTPIIVPLGAYVGQNVTISFRVTRCNGGGGHGARAYIEASCNPVALNASSSVVCSGSPVTLSAPNTPGYSYTWSGPGGFTGSSAAVNPTQAGVYTVTMAVTANPSCNMVMDTVLAAAPSPTPSFNFTVTPCAPTFSVPVISTSLPGAGDPISSYTWVWGDATANGSGTSTNHTYATSGPKTIQLQVMSVGGCSATVSQTLNFSPGAIANFNNTNVCLNGVTNFTATPTPSASAVGHSWDFGDGTPVGNGLNTSHTYTSSGIKTVTYTVTTTSGCQSVFTNTLNVFPNPVMAITANTVCLNLPTSFGNTSSVSSPATISTWAWDFDNNGSIDSGTQAPSNTYTAPGNYTAVLTATTSDGCVNTSSIGVKVNALPTATFTPVNACLNTNVVLNNTSSIVGPDIIQTYAWNFGAGANPATGSASNVTPLVYSTPGIKNITLNLISNNTCTATITQTVEVFAQPIANFSVSSVCQGTASAYTDLSTSTGAISAWAWDFTNNGSVDNGTSSPTNIFASSGTFTTGLIVTDNRGCKDTVALPVNIWGHAIPDFSANTVCLGSISSFSNTTNTTTNANVGGISTWAWNFGDGSTSSLQDPSNTYTSNTTYTYSVTLTATTTNGCVDNVVKTVAVNILPTATFTPVNACVNANVLLNNASTIPLPDNITTYAWNFGTGALPATSSSVQNPPTLTYNTSGVKTITLTITANTTCSASITQTVEVYAQPAANFSATAVCQGTATAYTDLSTPTGSITGWSWSYTNNGTSNSTLNAPSHIFPTSGTFTTSLIVTDNRGCKDTVALPIDVWGHTIPNFTPDKVCFGTSSVFTNLTDETSNPNVGAGTTYSWNFADGSATSNLVNPSHTYTSGGNVNATYNVTLTATSLHNCVDNAVKVVNVYAIPTASFTADSVCFGSPSHLTNASNGNGNLVNTFAWDFSSDGTVDVTGIANPNYVFPAIGSNPVTYTVSTSPVIGLVCANVTNSISVWVNPNPIPDFTFVNNCINAQPNTFNGSSSSIAIGTNTLYVWAFGNGISVPSAASTSTVSYAAPGVYNVTLTVTSNKGCVKNIVKQVEVYAKPIMKIANSPACDGVAMTFSAQAQAGSGTATNWYWDFNNSIFSIEATGQNTNFTFTGPGAQIVGLVSETGNGCRDTVVKSIYVNYVPVPQFSVNIPSGCPTHCVNFNDLTPAVTGPAQITQWQWSLGDGSMVSNSSNVNVAHCYNNTSSNQLALFNVGLTVTTDSGCVGTLTKANFITVYPKPIASYIASPNPASIIEPLVYFTNQSQDYTKWWWTFVGTGPFKIDSVNVNPTHLYDSETAQTYYSNLIVMNQYGCSDTAYVPVEITPEFTFYIPNAFSPSNGDGINDYFTGTGIGIDTYEMWVFDRWGERIFYTDDIKKGWDGRVQGKSAEGKQDVYVWKVRLKDVLGKKHEYVGHVTLLR